MNPGYSSPSIPQDTVHLTVHLPSPHASSLSSATAIASQISHAIHELLPQSWIWHRDSLELKVDKLPAKKDGEQLFALKGIMRVGDSIEDEWVAVWLIREITKKWQGVIGSIYDSDGDFLLIEAAHVLPNWVTPSNSENRVWIASGSLYLIPLSISSPLSSRPPKRERRLTNVDSDDEDEDAPMSDERASGWITEEKALEEVRAGRWKDAVVQSAVWDRISGYPATLNGHQHTTTMYLPLSIAQALARQPSLIQKAIETFYTRDPSQLRKAAKMTRFPPANAPLTQVTMTRTAYAQLQGQEFFPSKAFGKEWMDPITLADDAGQPGEKAWRERGVKVAVGFEILCGESKARMKEYPALDPSGEAGEARLAALKSDEEFGRYMDTLKRAGWFGEGEIEGSQRWKARENEAAQGWLKLGKGAEDDSSRPSFATLFSSALSLSGPSTPSELAPTKPDDPEDWLEVDPSQLDTLMHERFSGAPPTASETPDEGKDVEMGVGTEENEGVRRLEELAKKVGSFVGGQGGLEGAIFDDEMLSDDEDDDDAQLEKDMAADLDDLSSDEEPASMLTPSQREARMATLVKPLDPSEWGIQNQRPTSIPPAAPASAAGASLPLSSETRSLEDLDRQQKLKELRDEQAKNLPPIKMRQPILPRDTYDGVDSEEESDDELASGGAAGISAGLEAAMKADAAGSREDDEEEEDEDDMPQVVGEMEVDMGEEEEDFLKFARDALGLDEGMWESILKDRNQRGVFVPTPKPSKAEAPSVSSTSGLKSASLSTKSSTPKGSSNPTVATDSTPAPSAKAVRFEDVLPLAPAPAPAPASSTDMPLRERRDQPRPAPPPGAVPDPTLDSFEAVMKKMDEELERRKAPKGKAPASAAPPKTDKPKKVEPKVVSKPKASSAPSAPPLTTSKPNVPSFDYLTASDKPPKNTPVVDSDSDSENENEDDFDPDDPMLAMDAELRAALLAAGDLGSDDEDAEGLEGDDKVDYNLIKHFLESYKSQGGMAGPVGNLLGRLKG